MYIALFSYIEIRSKVHNNDIHVNTLIHIKHYNEKSNKRPSQEEWNQKKHGYL